MNRNVVLTILLLASHMVFAQSTFLWKISDTLTNKTSILFGSYHLIGNSFIDSIPEIEEYLINSDLAVFESIQNQNNIYPTINNRKHTTNFKKELGNRYYDNLSSIFINHELNVDKLNPIELKLLLIQEFIKTNCNTIKPNDKRGHLDKYLMDLADKAHIKKIGLETDSIQISLIDQSYNNPTWDDLKEEIRYWIKETNSNNPSQLPCEAVNKYLNYDFEYNFDKECKKTILVKTRNMNWMTKLPDLIKTNNCFISVGISHLYNKCGLIISLEQLGFYIEPIELQPAGNKGYN